MKHNYSKMACVETIVDPMPCMSQLVQDKIDEFEARGSEDAFCVGDVGDVINKFNKWRELMPRVEPFYAVKCNSDNVVLKVLADMGAGFDCASKGEISQVMKLGVEAPRIIYANPCKQKSFIKYAAKHRVDLMTFDNEAELIKVKEIYPDARMVLRILPIAQYKVQCQLGNKFGCHPDNVRKLLLRAKELDVNVMGVSFHVGSGVGEAKAFAFAVKQAYEAWQIAKEIGFKMTMLDIGGGFPGQTNAPITFSEIATVVNEALDIYFPPDPNVRIIAEPGRYMVASAFTLAVNIIAKRSISRDVSDPIQQDEQAHMYYVNDGVYGSLNCIIYDHAHPEARVISDSPDRFSSSIWGPTCDGLDCIVRDCKLPELEVGQWMYFADMGAYTMAASSTFNGMPRPECFYVCSDELWSQVYPEHSAPKKRCESLSVDVDFPVLMAGPDVQSLREAVSSIACCNEDEIVFA